jgi:hypothetical protein
MRAVCAAACAAGLLGACGKRAPREGGPVPEQEQPAAADGGVALPADAAAPWPEFEGMPRVEAERVVPLPVKPDVPRFSVGGPAIAGDLAIVSSSQFGFIAVDWRRGTIEWTKPAGLNVAPPVVLSIDPLSRPSGGAASDDGRRDNAAALVADCFSPPAVTAGDRLLGCLRVVTLRGVDQAYMAILGAEAAVEPFAASRGPQSLWRDGERTIRWRRGEHAVAIDLISGRATPAAAAPPPLAIAYKDKRWEIAHEDGRIVAHAVATGAAAATAATPPRPRRLERVAWSTQNRYTALIGSIWLPDMAPMLRIVNLGGRDGSPVVRVIDMDATGSLNAAIARPMPGIALLGWDTSSVGDTALAIRLDRSLRRDFIAGYAANAMVMWVHPLPEVARPDPIGVAVAPEAVVVFHDGDTLTILPELSAPPTAPGAARAPSQNPTP